MGVDNQAVKGVVSDRLGEPGLTLWGGRARASQRNLRGRVACRTAVLLCHGPSNSISEPDLTRYLET
jgi:hypothetical protein